MGSDSRVFHVGGTTVEQARVIILTNLSKQFGICHFIMLLLELAHSTFHSVGTTLLALWIVMVVQQLAVTAAGSHGKEA